MRKLTSCFHFVEYIGSMKNFLVSSLQLIAQHNVITQSFETTERDLQRDMIMQLLVIVFLKYTSFVSLYVFDYSNVLLISGKDSYQIS